MKKFQEETREKRKTILISYHNEEKEESSAYRQIEIKIKDTLTMIIKELNEAFEGRADFEMPFDHWKKYKNAKT